MQPTMIDLSPLSRPEKAVYRLWTQRRFRDPPENQGDDLAILVVVAMTYGERIGLTDDDSTNLAIRLAQFDRQAHSLFMSTARARA